MHVFNENVLISELAVLSSQAQTAFAAAAATRQLVNYEKFAETFGLEKSKLSSVLTELWSNIMANNSDRSEWLLRLDELMSLLPDEDDDGQSIWHALADDAISSLAYSVRCFIEPATQEAAWSARRAYEAADQIAIRILDIQPGLPDTEAKIRSHSIVQRELTHQQSDLALLREGLIEKVRQQAYEEGLITPEEIISLPIS